MTFLNSAGGNSGVAAGGLLFSVQAFRSSEIGIQFWIAVGDR
jgi:hypothetical protein